MSLTKAQADNIHCTYYDYLKEKMNTKEAKALGIDAHPYTILAS